MRKKRIGMLSYWGWPRGMAYTKLCYAKMLQDDYDIYILKQFSNKIEEEFKKVKVHVTENPTYQVDGKVFRKWVKDNKLDVVLFEEYNQWKGLEHKNDLIKIAKEEGAKTLGYLVMEKFRPEQTEPYDRIICPTVTFERFMRAYGIRKFSYMPTSMDLTEFPDYKNKPKNKKFTFYHPGGWGGVYNRKNTELVIKAFMLLSRGDTKLVISSQKGLKGNIPKEHDIEVHSGNLSRKEMLDLYHKADAVLLPSKWETVGIPILESLASGTPVITTNAPPMNEFIREGLNGYLCTGKPVKYEDISIHAIETNEIELKTKMENIMNSMLLPMLKNNSRYVAENLYDLKKNSKYFKDIIEKVTK